MSQRTLLQSDYSRGSVQDVARHVLPPKSAWKITDYFPNRGAPLRKRGGWEYASPALAGATYCPIVAYPQFSAGAQLVGIDNTGALWDIDSTTVATNKGAAQVPLQAPIFFNDLLIIPSATGAADPTKWTGVGAPAALGGTPPNGKYALVYKSRLILALDKRLYFSGVLNPESWDTANAFIDADDNIVGLAALRNAIFIFGERHTEWIRGSDPPPDTDMVRERKFEMGCLDARSITNHGDTIIWANGEGVWQTDGAALDNILEIGGLSQYWASLMEVWTSSYSFSAFASRGLYVLTVMNGSTFIDTLVCDIARRTWTFMSNITGTMFAVREGATEDIYMGVRDEARVAKITKLFDPDSTVRSDADGTAVQPQIETVFFRAEPGSKRWQDLVLGNVLLDSTSNAYLDFGLITDLADTTYDLVYKDDGVTLRKVTPGTGLKKSKIPLHKPAEGIGIRIRQVGASDDTMLFDIEALVRSREMSR